MRDEDNFFSFAIQFFIIAVLLVAVFHGLFNADDKKLKAKNKELVLLEQDLANATVRFAALIQPDVLRPIVIKTFPSYAIVGTGRTINVGNLE